MTTQSLFYRKQQLAWQIDPQAVGALLPWAKRKPHILNEDINGMARYFPHWLLVGSAAGQPTYCPSCALTAVPTQDAIRCPKCSQPIDADGICWIGQIPALVRPESRFTERLSHWAAAGYAPIPIGQQSFLLIPLQVHYPAEWPNTEPAVRYLPGWLEAADLPSYAAYHLIGSGQACLYSYGEWHAQPVHSVLQQRVVNHIASLLKIVAGVPAREAFIGNAH
jgi:hypothetical protein